jgi:hypothetical protein
VNTVSSEIPLREKALNQDLDDSYRFFSRTWKKTWDLISILLKKLLISYLLILAGFFTTF